MWKFWDSWYPSALCKCCLFDILFKRKSRDQHPYSYFISLNSLHFVFHLRLYQYFRYQTSDLRHNFITQFAQVKRTKLLTIKSFYRLSLLANNVNMMNAFEKCTRTQLYPRKDVTSGTFGLSHFNIKRRVRKSAVNIVLQYSRSHNIIKSTSFNNANRSFLYRNIVLDYG